METFLFQYLDTLFDKPLVHLADTAISFSTLIYVAIILVVANAVYLFVRILVNIQIKRNKIRSAQGRSLLQLFGYILTIISFLFIIRNLGYSLSYFLVGSTALLVGLGFGLQQLLLDVVSGVILLIDKNVNLGDVVRVDIPSGKEDMHGRIHHIGIRATLLQTIDNEFMVIPNSKFLASGVRSLMRDKGSARFRINIQVQFSEDMEKARRILMEAVLKDERVDKTPTPTIIIRDFRDNGVLLEIRFWMKELFNSENILSDIRFQILQDFNNNKIVIPYPQRVIQKIN